MNGEVREGRAQDAGSIDRDGKPFPSPIVQDSLLAVVLS